MKVESTTGQPGSEQERLAALLSAEARETSTATVLFHQAIAERLGLNPADHKCAELIARVGVITAGDLAERTGLTTGAITGLLDRLEQRGFVRRERDTEDRRRVLVYPVSNPEREREIAALFAPLASAWEELCRDYSEEELTLILEFLSRGRRIVEQEMHRLK